MFDAVSNLLLLYICTYTADGILDALAQLPLPVLVDCSTHAASSSSNSDQQQQLVAALHERAVSRGIHVVKCCLASTYTRP
jgi:hypothetical protein